MENNVETPVAPAETAVKSVENLDFLDGLKLTMSDRPPAPEQTPAPAKEELPVGSTTPAATTEKPAETPATNTTQTTNTENTPATPAASEPQYEITDEDLGPILSDATKGLIQDVGHLHEILEDNRLMQERLQELEANPVGVFKDPRQAAIAKFLLDYKGDDFHTGIQTYAKLNSLKIQEMSAEDALMEDYIMGKAEQGVSRTDAEAMFNAEFEDKYSKYGELADKFKTADAFEARKRLAAAQQKFTAEPKVDDQTAQKQQEFTQARERFEQGVERALRNEKGEEYKTLSLTELTENPENDFHYEVENLEAIEGAMYNYQGWFEGRYVTEGGGFNTERMKQDLTLIENFETISQKLFEHGKTFGHEQAIKERLNIPNKNDTPASQLVGDGSVPANWNEVKFTQHLRKPL